MKKSYCPICDYESDESIENCPICAAKMRKREESVANGTEIMAQTSHIAKSGQETIVVMGPITEIGFLAEKNKQLNGLQNKLVGEGKEIVNIVEGLPTSVLGFKTQEIRVIWKIPDKPVAPVVVEKSPEQFSPIQKWGNVSVTSENFDAIVERVFIFLEDGEWERADYYCEQALDFNPKAGKLYLGKLMAELHIKKTDDLQNLSEPFDSRNNCIKASSYDSSIAEILKSYNNCIRERNEKKLKIESDRAIKQKIQLDNETERVSRALTIGTDLNILKRTFEDAKQQENDLSDALKAIDTVEPKLLDNNSELEKVLSQIKELEIQRASLGVFAGKEKKSIDSQLAFLAEKKDCLLASREGLLNQVGGYETKKDIIRDYSDASHLKSKTEEQIKTIVADEAYNYYYAFMTYLNNPQIRNAVNAKIYRNTGEESVYLGRYPQSKEGSPVPIEWRVIEKHSDRIHLISRYVLDFKKYHNTRNEVTWETCALRKWLNSVFFNSAFSESEKMMLAKDSDKVFLLSDKQAQSCFKNDIDRRSSVFAYSEDKASFFYSFKPDIKADNNKPSFEWWLRSNNKPKNSSSVVYQDGTIGNVGGILGNDKYVDGISGVRPAICISISALQEMSRLNETIKSEFKQTTDNHAQLNSSQKNNTVESSSKSVEQTIKINDGSGDYDVQIESIENPSSLTPITYAISEATGLTYWDAQKLLWKIPTVVRKNTSKEKAKEIKQKLESAGATVIIMHSEENNLNDSGDAEKGNAEPKLESDGSIADGNDEIEYDGCDLYLSEIKDPSKRSIVTYAIVELLRIDYWEAQKKVDETPCLLISNTSKKEANIIKTRLENTGATVNFKKNETVSTQSIE